MVRVVLDAETASLADLRLTGVHVYAADPSTRVTVLCYAIDDGPVRTWTGGPCPGDLAAAIIAGCVVVAHNYLFELNIWAAVLVPLGFPPVAVAQWSCTMARALVAGLPASLEMAGHALGLAVQKDASARDLMLRFARPRSLTPLTWWHETDLTRFARLVAYCAQDVAAERALDRRVPELDPREREIFLADHAMNTRGIRADLALVDRMAVLSEAEKARVNQRLNRLTNGRVTSAAQVARLVAWLNDNRVAVPIIPSPSPDAPGRPTLGRAAVEGMLLRPGLPGHVQAALRCRLDASRSSTAKLTTVRRSVSADHRLRGTTQYYGANRTGRWAGRRFQPQNLPRATIKDVTTAVRLIEAGAPAEDLELLFEDTAMGVLASSLRSVIHAAPGSLLVACDLSQIEARVLVWLAGQDDMTDIFRRGEDVYVYTAARLGSDNRQFGKVLVLATGFGMGAARFQATAAGYGVILSLAEAEDAVRLWREMNTRVVDLWWGLHRAVVRVLAGPVGSQDTVRGIVATHDNEGLILTLPSGRPLFYWGARLVRHPEHHHVEIVYRGVEQGRWVELRTWPGKLCLAEGTLVLTEQGWTPIQLVSRATRVWDGDAWVHHDGVVCNGIADCIAVDGVSMTPGHEVLTTEGWRHAEFSAGFNRYPVQLPDGFDAPGSRGASWRADPQTRGGVAGALRLRDREVHASIRLREGQGEILRVPTLHACQPEPHHAWHVEASSVRGLAFDERPLPPSHASGMEELRWPGDHGMPGMAGVLRGVLARHGADVSTGSEYRPAQQRQRVFTGKLRLENHAGTGGQPPRLKKVYDITNAGPRHRFVVAGHDGPLIVHNCENVVQAIARDVMCEALILAYRRGVPLVMTVHDELVAEIEAARAPALKDWLLWSMHRPVRWAPGLPVAAEARVGPRYAKAA